MIACVLDASFTFQWLFRDEASPEGYAALAVVGREGAIIPPLWFTEITNGLGMAERRGRISHAGMPEAINLLRSPPLEIDEPPSLARCEVVLDLMRTYRLTAYDATYLELAQRRGLSLASRDRDLLVAAPTAGLFRTSRGHKASSLSTQAMTQPDAWRMIRRRAAAAGIDAPIGNHTFRATGITAHLVNGGVLKHAQEMAAHESPRTTKLYDRTKDRLTQDEVERIRL